MPAAVASPHTFPPLVHGVPAALSVTPHTPIVQVGSWQLEPGQSDAILQPPAPPVPIPPVPLLLVVELLVVELVVALLEVVAPMPPAPPVPRGWPPSTPAMI
jgi:hypothetical protein